VAVSQYISSTTELREPDRLIPYARHARTHCQTRLDLPTGVYTGIWWYASFPNHYQGDAAGATEARGKAATEAAAARIAAAIRAIKADNAGPRLQKEFFDAAQHPVDTKQ
jgi:creatinine amidohydrolase